MTSETSKQFFFRKVNDVSIGAVGGVLGTALWQTYEDSAAKGGLTPPSVRKVAEKAIFTLPIAITFNLLTDLSNPKFNSR